MSKLRLILNDQLSLDLPTLKDVQPQDVILICEAKEEYSYVKHHQKKIVFQILALREFVRDLEKNGWDVRHIQLDDPQNTGSLEDEVQRLLKERTFEEVILTEPNEWRLHEKFQVLQKAISTPLKILEDTRFLCEIQEFQALEAKHKTTRMEFFYREMRKKHGILLELDGSPVGGQWNYDKENRSPPRLGMKFPKRIQHKKPQNYPAVVELVESLFPDHFGDIEPFDLATTRTQALEELDYFIQLYLPQFGLYQDAMLEGEAYLYHSRISPYLNIGLLNPLEICQKAEDTYRQGHAPLNSVEGFIRQVLGWREYVRGIYWAHMPQYANMNYLKAERKLPDFYWTGETDMNCLREAISQTRRHAYSHHIQRLMVTGNFALIAGLNPIEVCEWYLVVYADAYDWVELPNTLAASWDLSPMRPVGNISTACQTFVRTVNIIPMK